MGSCCSFLSCKSSVPFEGIRVVHLNGYVEDFDEPITVSQVTGKPSRHFLCSPGQLRLFGSQPLGPEAQLQRGELYFLLPHSVLQSESSPVDLASLATRLTAIAMRGSPKAKSAQLSPHSGPSRSSSDMVARKAWMTGTCGEKMSPSVRSWKPVLDTIEEKSFDRRSDTVNDLSR